jgi:hypothetical protein
VRQGDRGGEDGSDTYSLLERVRQRKWTGRRMVGSGGRAEGGILASSESEVS